MREAARINIGILAHVDAGKTTLAETILYLTGGIRRAGRVDHGDAFLDTYALEKDRGITIFSKMAQVKLRDLDITLLDTPGHADFSAEMERTLQVLDYALLVISGPDGVQGHVQTLWRLLRHYHIPVFLFVNKMDQPGTDPARLMHELKSRLDSACVRFSFSSLPEKVTLPPEALEEIAVCDEELMERYLEGEKITQAQIRGLIQERKIYPCFFGSALRMTGVEELLAGLHAYLCRPAYPDQFGARVYKILREGTMRLTFLKVTGGTLQARQMIGEEKADQLRLYSGAAFTPLREAPAGTVCAVTGLTGTGAGMGLGIEEGTVLPVLEPVLTYGLELPEGADVHQAYLKLGELAEEIPELHLSWDEETRRIHVQVMGEVQTQILQSLIRERLGLEVSFGAGHIVYKETIANTVEGMGHYEPLRHYAEVHLILEPGERGSGITLESICPTDELDLNWQRLIFSHLRERTFQGVLTGSELTDVKITLAAGRAHIKHTEGGDFRQATYRAIRHALMQAESLLLEPVYSFRLEIPQENVGRAIADIQAMHGSFLGPETEEGAAVLTGTAPVAGMRGYQTQVRVYTGGSGRLQLSLKGYAPCHNAREVIDAAGYDPETDERNPAGSVFCVHGAGMYVPWREAGAHMHLESVLAHRRRIGGEAREETGESRPGNTRKGPAADFSGKDAGEIYGGMATEQELMEIFTRTYGASRKDPLSWNRRRAAAPDAPAKGRKVKEKEQVLLVDGYNIIFDWEELRALAEENLDGARMKLMEILSNFQGFRQMKLILVFDAYKVSGGSEESFRHHNIYVVYTREAETADAYIERTVHELASRCDVTVATSDAAEQVIIWGQGARRMSARELKEEITQACREIQQEYLKDRPGGKRYLFENLSEDMAALLERMRLGK